MRVFGVQPDGQFSEYVQTPFQVDHAEAVLEDWLESNPDGIVEDGRILIIGRQVVTNFGGFIDLLGLDREGDVVVVELKRDRTPRDTIAQSLEYVSFAERLDTAQLEGILRSYLNDDSLSLAEHHREYFELGSDEAVAFNKDQRIVIVGQRVTPEIRQTATFLRSKGLRVTCVEFTFFQADGGTRLLSQEIVVGTESEKPKQVSSGSLPVVTEDAFLASADENGKAVFARILKLAKSRAMPIHWGTKGFSLNVDLDGTHVAVCFVYPPDSVYKQTLRTTLRDRGGVEKKSAVPEDEIQRLWKQAEATGLFAPAGRDLKCQITRPLTEPEIDSLVQWCESVEKAVKQHGLKQ
ncbi:endonuclease NucS domain-containing protein [Candidatus Electrothrix sp.]|uniref:endonuclease NucS domain-containing protein n=1 Tax=Candidatus Electrothrix sp. TaxID=2170559 RepID=UPI004055B027